MQFLQSFLYEMRKSVSQKTPKWKALWRNKRMTLIQTWSNKAFNVYPEQFKSGIATLAWRVTWNITLKNFSFYKELFLPHLAWKYNLWKITIINISIINYKFFRFINNKKICKFSLHKTCLFLTIFKSKTALKSESGPYCIYI